MFKSKSLLSINADAKTSKGETFGFLTGIMYLAPYKSTEWNTCSMAQIAECGTACLFSAGRGAMSTVAQGRINKTVWFFTERTTFMQQLVVNIRQLVKKAAKQSLIPLVRLNGTSDIRWETVGFTDVDGTEYVNIFAAFPDIQFYDYTKIPSRNLVGKTSGNYDLTYSFSAITPKPISIKGLTNPNNSRVAVVFQKQADIPTSFRSWPVVDGDDSDVRHIEPKNVVVALYAKGKAKREDNGFVQIKGIHYA